MYDVLIVGGGPVGACAGALLARGEGGRGLSVALLEPKPPAPLPAGAPLEARVVAVSRASERTLTSAGAWPGILGPRLCAYERMRIWHESVSPTSASALVFDAADVGEPNLGYIVENRLLQSALLAAFVQAGGHLEAAQFSGLRISDDAVEVQTTRGTLSARLIIGADGAQSAVRAAAGLTAETSGYAQTAIVATVATVPRIARSNEMRRGK